MLGITNVSNAPSIVLKDTVVSTWTSGSYNGYSYRGSIPIIGVTDEMIAEVTFSQAQAESGNYSSICTTYDGGLYVYSKVNTQITIPSIIIHSIVESYYEMDNAPTQGSTRAVTSGGILTALNNVENTIYSNTASISTASSAYSTIASTNIQKKGKYLLNLAVGFGDYANSSGWFLRSHLGTHSTFPFISGLLASGTASIIISVTSVPATVSVGVAQFSGGTMTVSGTVTAIRLCD